LRATVGCYGALWRGDGERDVGGYGGGAAKEMGRGRAVGPRRLGKWGTRRKGIFTGATCHRSCLRPRRRTHTADTLARLRPLVRRPFYSALTHAHSHTHTHTHTHIPTPTHSLRNAYYVYYFIYIYTYTYTRAYVTISVCRVAMRWWWWSV